MNKKKKKKLLIISKKLEYDIMLKIDVLHIFLNI